MYIYKFRLLSDDIDSFVRDYEICSKQTFKDFHDIIMKSIKGLNPNELASFYICDRKWNKLKEITLVNMDAEVEEFKNDNETEEDERDKYLVTAKTIMSDAVISKFIDDPHQYIIYEQDFLNPHTFYIELIKSLEGKEGKKYPVCTNSKGELPKSAKFIDENNIDELTDENDEEDEENMFYDDEDLNDLSTDLSENLGL